MCLTDRLRTLLRQENRLKLIVLLGLTGIAMILLSGMLPGKQSSAQHEEPPPAAAAEAASEPYRILLEERLTALLSQMDGVGAVTVMITVSGSPEQIYASEISDSSSDRGKQSSVSPVLVRSGGSESALIAETRCPAVSGAVILCTGGSHAAVRENVTKAAAALLGISANRIFVGKAAPVSAN